MTITTAPFRRQFDESLTPQGATNSLQVQPGVHVVALGGGAATVGANHIAFTEIADPAAPAANGAKLYIRDSAGKSQLVVRFSTGAIQVIATEP